MRRYNKLRARMFEMEYNQTDLAEITGHSQGTISNWMTGKSDIRRGDILAIAKALEIPPEEWPEYFFPELTGQTARKRAGLTMLEGAAARG